MELHHLVWEENFSVGFKLIDDQHKRLFGIYNRLIDSRKGNARLDAGDCLAQLAEYVRTHFVTEEEVLRVYGYDEYEEHKAQHDIFARNLVGLQEDFAQGDMVLPDSVVALIKEWLVHHVLGEDQKYKGVLPRLA